MIKINSKELNTVIKNITDKNKNELRPHIKYINIVDGKLRITDGRILFVLNLTIEIKNGYYEVIKTTKKETILGDVSEYHDYKDFPETSAITDLKYETAYRKHTKNGEIIFVNKMHKDHFTAQFAVANGVCLSSFYVGIAFDLIPGDCHFIDNKHPVKFTGDNFEFFIMPIINH